MKTNLFLFISFCISLLTACTSDNDTDNSSPGKLPVVTLYAGYNAASRTVLDNAGNINWSVSDVINVNGSASTNTVLSNGNASAAFTAVAASPYYAFYPQSMVSGYNSTTHTFAINFPATQTYKDDVSFSDAVNPAVATNPTTSLMFYNLCGMLRVPISTNTVATKARFVSINASVAGTATVDVTNHTMTVTGSTQTMDITSVPQTSSYTLNWVLPAGTYTAGWKIQLLDAGNNVLVEKVSVADLIIVRAKITNVSSTVNMKNGIYSGGIYWAKGNLVAPTTSSYTFATAQETYTATSASGYYFCWNTLNSQSTSSSNTGSTYLISTDPCQSKAPAGAWRMPTSAELTALMNTGSVWGTKNSVNGRYFGTTTVPTVNVDNYVFLPAAGDRDTGSTTMYNVGTIGHYWSSAPDATTTAYGLNFSSSYINMNSNPRGYGFTVRCVSE